MQEFSVDELEFETSIEEETDTDSDSINALEEFFQARGIKNSKDIPAIKEASLRARSILKKFCSEGNHKNRLNRVIEFYKCLDWIPFNEIDLSLLSKFEDNERKLLLKEINIYLNKKEEKIKSSTKWRKEYKERVWQYYKEKVSSKIKLELEQLRDYELNLVGHDRNWQYYFYFKSFKKIDEFVNLTVRERESVYGQFKRDVIIYKNNRDQNLAWQEYGKATFNTHWDDDIVKSINWEINDDQKGKNTNNKHSQQFINEQLTTDHITLGIPVGANIDTIKKQYRKLAKMYHPDQPNGNESKMKAIVSAYQRLIQK